MLITTESYYQKKETFSELTSTNIDIFRALLSNNRIFLGLYISNNSDTLEELIPKNRVHFFSEFKPISGDLLRKFLLINARNFPQSSYQTAAKLPAWDCYTIQTFLRPFSVLPTNTDFVRVRIKQYWQFLAELQYITGQTFKTFYQTKLTISEHYYQALKIFFQHLYQTILLL